MEISGKHWPAVRKDGLSKDDSFPMTDPAATHSSQLSVPAVSPLQPNGHLSKRPKLHAGVSTGRQGWEAGIWGTCLKIPAYWQEKARKLLKNGV